MRDFGSAILGLALALSVCGTAWAAGPDQPAASPTPAVSPKPTAEGTPVDLRSSGSTQPAKVSDGQYTDADGNPTYHVSQDGKTVDWYTMSGYLRYSANCIVCHGPDGMGSTYAPALVDSLKTLDYATFAGIVIGGKKDVNASQELVMPAFGENKNVMCYLPDIYTYLRARAEGALGRNRPPEHEAKPAAFAKAEDVCMK